MKLTKNSKKKTEPIIGDTRVLKTFALFPITVDNDCRWFEFVKIVQVLFRIHKSHINPTHYEWVDIKII